MSLTVGQGGHGFRRDLPLWTLAGLTAALAHAGAVYLLVAFAPPPGATALAEAMTVELAPLIISEALPVETETVADVAPETVEDAPEGPVQTTEKVEETFEETQTAEAVDETEPEEVEEAKSEEEVKDEPDEPVEETVTEEAEPVEPAEVEPVDVEPIPEVKDAEVVLPKAEPKPEVKQRKVEPRKVVKPVRKPVKKAEPKEKPVVTTQKKPTKTRTVAGASSSKARAADLSRWNSQVQAAVARRKPRARGETGQVTVSFTVTASGGVVGARISRSSGNAKLDRAALGMVSGARVPAPPPGSGRSSFPFSIPVSFR